MHTLQRNQRGIAHLGGLLFVVLIIAVIAAIGVRVMGNNSTDRTQTPKSNAKSDNSSVVWSFNEQKLEWFAKEGTPPKCKDPFVFDKTPVDLSVITSASMSGAYRGYSYKPHGGFRATDASNGQVQVVMPIDATLVSLTRYYEGNPSELQYLLTFETDCGIAFRFDHLFTLAPEFQKIAETTPEPKKDDSRTDPNRPFNRTKFKAGDVVANEVGFQQTRNYGFDFGVYDYRQRNEISKNEAWTKIHNQYQSLEWYGVCWLDMLPGEDSAKATALSEIIVNPSKPERNQTSDYCDAKYQTLDFNNGQPTDG